MSITATAEKKVPSNLLVTSQLLPSYFPDFCVGSTVITHLVAHSTGGTIQLVAHGFGRTLILAGTSTYIASAMYSVSGTIQLVAHPQSDAQDVPPSVL